MFLPKSECSIALASCRAWTAHFTKHDSTIISGLFFLLKALGVKSLTNQEELHKYEWFSNGEHLGKWVTVEETNDIQRLDADCENVEIITDNQGCHQQN